MNTRDMTAISAACELFDLHAMSVQQCTDGLLLTADRYAYRAIRAIPTTLLEDHVDPTSLLVRTLDEMATWLRLQPIINHDPGDEDRR